MRVELQHTDVLVDDRGGDVTLRLWVMDTRNLDCTITKKYTLSMMSLVLLLFDVFCDGCNNSCKNYGV